MTKAQFYYGNPNNSGSWEQAASIFAAHDSINSVRTSSLPLVQFWKPKGNGLNKHATYLIQKCDFKETEFKNAQFCFEYPVAVAQGRGKASMTDLMIKTNNYTIAIEAKWTEGEPETIGKWRNKGDAQNRDMVLKGWIDYINDYLKYKAKEWRLPTKLSCYDEIPYQMLHRIASACVTAKERGGTAAVIYQLFYDGEHRKGSVSSFTSTNQAKTTAEFLNNSYKTLFPDNAQTEMVFHTVMIETEIKRETEITAPYNDIFLLMQEKDVYDFKLPIKF